jgi:hypothetical protein
VRGEYAAAVEKYGSQYKAAAALGMNRLTFRSRLQNEKAGVKAKPISGLDEPDVKDATLPEFPNPDAPIGELIRLRTEQYGRTKARKEAEHWFPVRVKDALPVAIMVFGDPHVDDDGCNWPKLRHDVEIATKEPGVYAMNIGDTTNNWAGRLARLYAKQETSEKSAQRFAKWFLAEAGIPWIVWLMGNHDLWQNGSALLRAMNPVAKLPMLDWQARFAVVFSSGERIKVHAAHDFKGHSMWNTTHGPLRAAYMSSDADLLVCGDKHIAAMQQFVDGRGRWRSVARASGYKRFDDFAEQHGYQNAPDDGSAMFCILNPLVPDGRAGRVMVFADVDAGVAMLRTLRASAQRVSKRKAPRRKR